MMVLDLFIRHRMGRKTLYLWVIWVLVCLIILMIKGIWKMKLHSLQECFTKRQINILCRTCRREVCFLILMIMSIKCLCAGGLILLWFINLLKVGTLGLQKLRSYLFLKMRKQTGYLNILKRGDLGIGLLTQGIGL